MSTPSPTPPPRPKARRSRWLLVGFVLLLVAAAGGFYAYERYVRNKPEPPPDHLEQLRGMIQALPPDKLADGYADADRDLVADPPTGPDKWLKVGDEITFSVVPSPRSLPPTDADGNATGPSEDEKDYQPVMKAIEDEVAKRVKRKVTVRFAGGLRGTDDQLAAVREGKLHVTAFSTGAVPLAVNTAGFVPMYVPADADNGYAIQLLIVVRADSPIQTPGDLAGKAIGLVSLSSNSGGKAPLVLLKEQHDLLPSKARGGYDVMFTGDHRRGLVELLDGKYDAVCVASDLFAQAVAEGKIRYMGQDRPVAADRFRVIMTEGQFPPLCFGVPHNLPPDLRAAVGEALKGAKPPTRAKFYKITYKDDWKDVLRIDKALTRLVPDQ